MLREERQVGANEGHLEMELANRFTVHIAGYLGKPIIPADEDSEDRAKR